MIDIEWTTPAFAQLEALPQAVAFEIIRHVDLLAAFPQMGAPLEVRFPALRGYRQLVVKRQYRAVYEFDEHAQTIYVLAVQNCRQKLPARRDLKRQFPTEGDE
jgi:plasmid stabilization system protein ParE